MPPAQIILMGLSGLVFGWWTWLMFATLMGQRRRAMQRTGHIFPGLRDALLEWGHWLRASDLHHERRRLLFATLLMFAIIGLIAVFMPFTPSAPL